MRRPCAPAEAGVQPNKKFWAPAIGVPAKYYFAGCPCAGVQAES
jgi:hypothetical protein